MIGDNINVLNDQSPKVISPPEFKIKLKEHQKTIIARCIELENNGLDPKADPYLEERYRSIKTNIGVIADKVGSGKTYSILGLIYHNKTPLIKFNQTMMYGYNNINVELKDRDQSQVKLGLTLIVVPHSIVKQWKKCIDDCFKVEDYTIVNTSKSFNSMASAPLEGIKILLTSGTFYKRVQEYFTLKNYHVSRVIFDEVDSMNTPNAKHMQASFYWFVSASYKNVLSPYPRWNYAYNNWENSYQISSGISNNAYAKNIFLNFYKNHNPHSRRLIEHTVIKNDDDFVSKSFDLPEARTEIIRCRDTGLISILNGVVHSNIINCLNAGDVDGAVSYINQQNVDSESNIIDGVLQGLTIKMTNLNMELRFAKDCIYVNEDVKTKKIEKLTKDILELETRMALIKDRIKVTDICTICLENPKVKTITRCCNNSFCFECLVNWLRKKNTCPLCKATVNMESDLFVVKEEEDEDDESSKKPPTKLQFLQTYLSKIKPESKVLIFSENDNSFTAIENILCSLQIKYAKLKGNSINRSVDAYKNSDLSVLLVNSNAYGSGLNLENTTHCVLFHKFDNEVETQVLGRAQRPGRTVPLNVVYLLNDNEIMRH